MKNNVLAQLNNAKSAITSTLEVCMSSKNATKITSSLSEAKVKMTEALASVQDHPNKRNLTQTKKSLTVIDNLVSGLLEGVSSREIKVKDFRAACGNLQSNFLPKLDESISNEVEKFKAEAGISDDEEEIEVEELTADQKEIRQAILSAAEELSEDELEDEEDPFDREDRIAKKLDAEKVAGLNQISGDVERRLARMNALRSQFPQKNGMKTPYTILRMPVVPNFETESAKNPVLLDKLAIPYTEIPLGFSGRPTGITNPHRMERYVIFEQQYILLVSKDHIENLLTYKTEEVTEDNKDVARGIRQRRKELKKDLVEAEIVLDKIQEIVTGTIPNAAALATLKEELDEKMFAMIENAITTNESQEEEVKRLVAKLAEYNRAVDASFDEVYTAQDRELIAQLKAFDRQMDSIGRRLDARVQLYKTGAETKPAWPESAEERDKLTDKQRADLIFTHKEDLKNNSPLVRFTRDVEKLEAELNALEAKRKPAAKSLDSSKKKYAKSAALKKKLDQIVIMERKLDKVKIHERSRSRLLTDAETFVKRLQTEIEKHEENNKSVRKAIKRSGAPIVPEDYARSILSILNERSGSKYALVTSKFVHNPRNGGDLCFWLMPAGKLGALMRSTGGKAKVMQWDFPFQREEIKKLANQPSNGWVHVRDRTFDEVKDNPELLKQWLEYEKNAKVRPTGWKSQYNKPKRID